MTTEALQFGHTGSILLAILIGVGTMAVIVICRAYSGHSGQLA